MVQRRLPRSSGSNSCSVTQYWKINTRTSGGTLLKVVEVRLDSFSENKNGASGAGFLWKALARCFTGIFFEFIRIFFLGLRVVGVGNTARFSEAV